MALTPASSPSFRQSSPICAPLSVSHSTHMFIRHVRDASRIVGMCPASGIRTFDTSLSCQIETFVMNIVLIVQLSTDYYES
ncbi:hypothetical protein K503DRAFT_770463 [Rhizopogon vinicolor AM-OR11-026]|uniref:Uncharacterized protein n=1 Tax=Rhizopogon vinicolor AM-OR11-026 TaxID=1314800 RepID=A0A1B7N0T2_9AGAM|nr:hypothetical protein K503DRAFT_770463 [Rhizopogon vinicolor AM-OR11-026]